MIKGSHLKLLYIPSVIGIVVANMAVLAGALFFGWDLFTMVLVYWLETVVIGSYTMIKMFVLEPVAMVLLLPFYLFHFGIFLFVYLIFVFMAFGPAVSTQPGVPFLQFLLAPFQDWQIVLGVVPLIFSHGFSFVRNFWPRRAMYANKLNDISFEPYPRIMLMAPTLLFCAFVVAQLGDGQTRFGYIPLIFIKTCADVWSHLKCNGLLPRDWPAV